MQPTTLNLRLRKVPEKQGIDIDITKDVQKHIDKVKDDIDDVTGPIKRKF